MLVISGFLSKVEGNTDFQWVFYPVAAGFVDGFVRVTARLRCARFYHQPVSAYPLQTTGNPGQAVCWLSAAPSGMSEAAMWLSIQR